MNLEEIMKPYFDKKEELEKKQEVNNEYIEERRIVSLRLERLRDNKDREIEELRRQLQGKEELAKFVVDAQNLLGQSDY